MATCEITAGGGEKWRGRGHKRRHTRRARHARRAGEGREHHWLGKDGVNELTTEDRGERGAKAEL